MKTVQIVCGYSFALIHSNLYFWKAVDTKGNFRANFYDEIIIPDYTLKSGISVYMIVKIIIIVVVAILGNLIFNTKFIFKNDLAEYNLSSYDSLYDSEDYFRNFKNEKTEFVNILNNIK